MTDDEKLAPETQPNKRKRNKPCRRGAGSVFRRPDRKGKQWVAQLALENGKAKQCSVTPEAEADEALNERLSEQRHGTLLPVKDLTVKQQREHWIENVHTQTSGLSTSSADRRNSENHILPELGHRKLQQRTVRRGEAFDTKQGEEGVCAGSIKRLHSILSQTRDHAVHSNLITRNDRL
jgi:hypothetical protein